MKKAFLIIAGLASFSFGAVGFDLAWQRRWSESPLFSVGVGGFTNWQRGYITGGFNFFPAKNVKITEADISGDVQFSPHAYYGWYTGYHFRFSDFIRPGVVFGTGWENEEKRIDGKRVGYTGFSLVPYFGLDVHFAIFTFRLSNEGIGCGINVRFRGG